MLFAELYAMGIPDVPTRLRSLIDLSDQFNRPQELELAFIGAVLTAPAEARGDEEDIKARFQEALSTFQERFPDSDVIRSIAVGEDDSGDELIEKIRSSPSRYDAGTSGRATGVHRRRPEQADSLFRCSPRWWAEAPPRRSCGMARIRWRVRPSGP